MQSQPVAAEPARAGLEPDRAEPGVGWAHPALVFVQLCYGLFPAFMIVAGRSYAPRAVVVMRIGLAAVVFATVAWFRYGKRVIPARADVPRLVLCALFGVVINQSLALEGMVRSTATNAGLLMTLIPVFTFGLAVLVRQERATPRRALGIAVAMAGALVLILSKPGTPDLGQRYLTGNLLIATNCLSYSIFLLLSHSLLRRTPALVMIAQVFCLSLVALPFLARGQALAPPATGAANWALLYILVFPTVIAYFLNTYSLARLPASTTAVFIYLQPLVSGTAGVVGLGEELRPAVLVAAGLLFAGIWLVAFGRRRRRAG